MLPLRRQSFSLTKSPLKSFAALSPKPPNSNNSNSSSSRLTARRKSTSACLMTARSPLVVKNAPPKKSSVSSVIELPSAPPLATSSQMVLACTRAQERRAPGARDRQAASAIPRVGNGRTAGARALHDPAGAAPARRHAAAAAVCQECHERLPVGEDAPQGAARVLHEEGPDQGAALPATQSIEPPVAGRDRTHVKKQRQLAVKKQRLTTQLSLATTALNELQVTKYGRRGKPHETRLSYDPGEPTKLHWVRKNGERSAEALDVDVLRVQCYDGSDSSGSMSKALKRFAHSARLECCVSLIAPTRSLDLQLRSSLHRDWLVNALHDVIAFARQYKAASAASRALTQQQQKDTRRAAPQGRRE
ncbi:hypothetical protein PINS_up024009 [Pythium insidiosum]|nr:hypothetical protein PINS_up024009 [Pythium insidiosum]